MLSLLLLGIRKRPPWLFEPGASRAGLDPEDCIPINDVTLVVSR